MSDGGITARKTDDLIAPLGAVPQFASALEPMLAGLAASRYSIRRGAVVYLTVKTRLPRRLTTTVT